MDSAANPPRLRGGEPRSGGGGRQSLRRRETYNARNLRREMTLPEVLLWEQLRAGKLGAKFRRQHPIGPYIADFYCASLKLVIEIDGEAHNRGDRPARDEVRDQHLADQGSRVLRFAALEVLKNMDGVLAVISAEVDAPLHRFAVPLPASGEDLG
jgi:very-short-patch-repair endonuclease